MINTELNVLIFRHHCKHHSFKYINIVCKLYSEIEMRTISSAYTGLPASKKKKVGQFWEKCRTFFLGEIITFLLGKVGHFLVKKK